MYPSDVGSLSNVNLSVTRDRLDTPTVIGVPNALRL